MVSCRSPGSRNRQSRGDCAVMLYAEAIVAGAGALSSSDIGCKLVRRPHGKGLFQMVEERGYPRTFRHRRRATAHNPYLRIVPFMQSSA
jgi:hypothetical protein